MKTEADDEELRQDKSHARTDSPWTAEEDQFLLSAYGVYADNKNQSFYHLVASLMEKLEREPGAIKERIFELVEKPVEYSMADIKGKARGKKLERKKKDAEEGPGADDAPLFSFEDNPQAQEALRLMEQTRQNIFLTGEAGTGKSTLLKAFRKYTRKNLVVLAPTGVAALNVEGQTIHSFCAFAPDITVDKVKKVSSWSPKKKLLQKLETIIIDEVSMVRADLLDCVDKFLRLNGPAGREPFGGIQVILIGDLLQLPPVEQKLETAQLFAEYASPYFFDSHVFKSSDFKFVELKQIYRQKDHKFIELLNAIRNNKATAEHLGLLNQNCLELEEEFDMENFTAYLTTTNQRAKQVNEYFLKRLEATEKIYTGNCTGNFEDRVFPTDNVLSLKVGAQVIMLNNDRKSRWVNGTMGKVREIKKAKEQAFSEAVVVELENGELAEVFPHTWEMYKFYYDHRNEKIDVKTVGTFTQYPLKLAWAITIHKSQGKTFDRVIIDLGRGAFAYGQLYVALSRCKSLEGLMLQRPIEQKDIKMDERVVEFLKTCQA